MITVISTTNRINSNSLKIARFYRDALMEKDVPCKLLALENLSPSFIQEELYGERSEAFETLLDEYIRQSGRLIMVVPEYNGGFPGILKTFIDAVPPSDLYGKKVALAGVSAGRTGCQIGMAHLTDILHYLRMEVLSNRPKLSEIDSLLDENGLLINNDCIERIDEQLTQFLAFGSH